MSRTQVLDIFNLAVNIFLLTLICIIIYYKWCFAYWSKKGVPLEGDPRIPLGTMISPTNIVHLGVHAKQGYDKMKNSKHSGGYCLWVPKYLVYHPEYIAAVLQKDFKHFSERYFYHNERDDPLSANLFAIGGEKWKNLRTQLSPMFTPGKMKMMFPSMVQCATQMGNAIREKDVVDIEDVAQSYTIDVIGSCGFGLNCNSFQDQNAQFKTQGRKAFLISKFRLMKIGLCFVCPELARFLGVTLFSKETNDFFKNIVKESILFRENNNLTRQDVLQQLINLKTEGSNNGLSLDEITAQVFIFFAAGYETSALTLTYCLYELSLNEDIQNKVREEIVEVLRNYQGNITYEAISDMNCLGQIVDETLRKYPPVPFITRKCVKAYNVPDGNTVIDEGTETIVPVLALHHDPQYYPEPDKFIPERFSSAEKQKRTPCTYLPFGEGPRICIGQRFGLLQTKVGLISLLRDFQFTLNEKSEVPLKIEPFSFTYQPRSQILLNVKKLSPSRYY